MSDSYFKIENGVLEKYLGSDSVVTIPEGVTSIRHNAFYGCTSLKEVIIPSSITSIGDLAFEGCTNLEITIPKTVKNIGRMHLKGAKRLHM